MRYLHILMAFAAEPWAVEPRKLMAVSDFLKFKALGGDYSAEDVQARITQKRETEVARAQGDIAVIPVVGIMSQRLSMMDDISGGISTEQIAKNFRAALNDSTVKAIVMEFDSPGGTVAGTEELADEIFASRGTKPIIAQVNSNAHSAAYWVASQTDEIVVTPSGRAGSIGVYTVHDDISKFLEMNGVKETVIASHPNKIMGHESEPLTDDARGELTTRVAEISGRFTQSVARGRGTSVKAVNESFGRGLTFGAEQLIDRGMADSIATMPQTLERFGVHMNPALSRSRAASLTRADKAAETLIQKLQAGGRPTVRELENGLKGLGLTNSEAERAARVLQDAAQGEPEKPEADHQAIGAAIARAREAAGSFILPKL